MSYCNVFFFIFLFCLLFTPSIHSEPSLKSVISINVPMDDSIQQVTLYRDHDDKVKRLYLKPMRLVLKKQKGMPMFNAMLYRGIISQQIESKNIRESQAGILAGGIVDAVLELAGPVEDITEMKALVSKQYPQYSGWEIAYVPMTDGGVTIDAKPAYEDPKTQDLSPDEKKTISTQTSGGPVGTEVGTPLPIRFRLSQVDAAIMMEVLNKPDSSAFTSAFDINYTASFRVSTPEDRITITANKKRVYEYFSNHFKAKGGWWFWSFGVDLRKVTEKLQQDGQLEIKLERLAGILSKEEMQSIADKWVENFICKELADKPLDPMKPQQAQAENVSGTSTKIADWCGYASLGTSYSQTKLDQLEDRKVSFTYTFSGMETFKVHAKAYFHGLSSKNITLVDLNKSYFTYTGLAVKPYIKDVLKEPQLSSITVSLKGKAGKEQLRRTVSFDRDETNTYVTWMPLYLNYSSENGMLKGQSLDKLTYSIIMEGNGWELKTEPAPFEHSNWQFDMPMITLNNQIAYQGISFGDNLYQDYPNLKRLEVFIKALDAQRPVFKFNYSASNLTRYFFFCKDKDGIGTLKIVASYEKNRKIIQKNTEEKPASSMGKVVGDNFMIDIVNIPHILELGKD